MFYSLRKKLEVGEPIFGPVITLNCPEIAEIFTAVGFDWLFVDMEHGVLDIQGVQKILQATQGQCSCIIRAPSGEEVWIKKILDTGAEGILIPHVNTAEEARKVVEFCKYPPQGSRSVGISRAQGFGLQFQEYMNKANQNILVIIQVEHIKAVENIESIVKVPGIDAVFIGPYDLSGSMGKIGKVKDSEVLQKIDLVSTACIEAGLPLGIFGIDVDAVQPYINKSFTLIAVGVDTMFLGASAQKTLAKLRSRQVKQEL